jgi:hypothetical protein
MSTVFGEHTPDGLVTVTTGVASTITRTVSVAKQPALFAVTVYKVLPTDGVNDTPSVTPLFQLITEPSGFEAVNVTAVPEHTR